MRSPSPSSSLDIPSPSPIGPPRKRKLVAVSVSPDPDERPGKRSGAAGVKVKPEPSGKKEAKPKTKSRSTKNPGRPWTGEELDQLLTIALEGGGASRANYEGKIPGRTGMQCNQTWRNTLLPYLHHCAKEKGTRGPGGGG